jgi:hypothetical protein
MAVCHSPAYETEHKDSLAQDWAHLPIPKNLGLMEEAVTLGGRVATLLDPAVDASGVLGALLGGKARVLAVPSAQGGGTIGERDLVMSKAYFGAARGDWRQRVATQDESLQLLGSSTGDLYINDAVFFGNVPEMVWKYELGGYPVLKKWLGYRHAERNGGRPLTLAEADHLRSIVQRLAALLVLAPELDALYERVSACCFTREELGFSAA